jgi:hypothetical protein
MPKLSIVFMCSGENFGGIARAAALKPTTVT